MYQRNIKIKLVFKFILAVNAFFIHFYVHFDTRFNNLKVTIKFENQNLVRYQNISLYRRRFARNLIQISLLLFEIKCFEVTQLQKIIFQ